MKRILPFLLVCLILCGCSAAPADGNTSGIDNPHAETTQPTTVPETTEPTTVPTTAAPTETLPVPTLPPITQPVQTDPPVATQPTLPPEQPTQPPAEKPSVPGSAWIWLVVAVVFGILAMAIPTFTRSKHPKKRRRKPNYYD